MTFVTPSDGFTELPASLKPVAARGVVIVDPAADGGHFSPSHPESPERVVEIRKALSALRSPMISFESSERAHMVELAPTHTPDYINSVEAMSAGGGGWFDGDTYCTSKSYDAALFAVGAAKSAVDIAVEGKHAFALSRPPGHHAFADRAKGFCLFNNVAWAANYALTKEGIGKVAIIDIDVHHGDGTQDIVNGEDSLLYVSLHEWPSYPMTGGPDSSHGNIVNIPLPAGTDEASWLDAFDTIAQPAVEEFGPDLILVSCGFDTLSTDVLADFELTPMTYSLIARRVAALTAMPTAWCLEGGYDPAGASQAACSVVEALAGV